MIAKANNVFITASQARLGARNNLIIHEEIRDIEYAILKAIDLGQLSVKISNTQMTFVTDYYKVWQKQIYNSVLEDQMDVVITYFTNLGYSITRKESSSNIQFYWELFW
jgi:hypothetical protein